MSRLFFSPTAVKDLDGIFEYIAADNLESARRFVGKLKKTCSRIAAFPGMGVARDDLAAGLLFFPVESYLIFYRSRDTGVEIVRVLQAARDYVRLLDQ